MRKLCVSVDSPSAVDLLEFDQRYVSFILSWTSCQAGHLACKNLCLQSLFYENQPANPGFPGVWPLSDVFVFTFTFIGQVSLSWINQLSHCRESINFIYGLYVRYLFGFNEDGNMMYIVILQAGVIESDRKPKLPPPKRLKLPVQKRHKLTPSATVCFVCWKDAGNETVCCSRRRCAKIYHLACLKLHERPPGYDLLTSFILLSNKL